MKFLIILETYVKLNRRKCHNNKHSTNQILIIMSTVFKISEHREGLKPGVIHRRSGYLQSVITRIRGVLSSGTEVFLYGENSQQSYTHQIYNIRLHSSGEYFQVKTSFGWTPVLYSETLVDAFGEEFFSSPKFCEMNDSQLDAAIARFIRDFGVYPWNSAGCKAV